MPSELPRLVEPPEGVEPSTYALRGTTKRRHIVATCDNSLRLRD